MKKRVLGATGLWVSEIGMGCEGMLENDCAMARGLIDAAQEYGINYFDLYSPDPALHRALGAALEGRWDHFILQAHLCSAWIDGQYKRTRVLSEVKDAFECQLKNLRRERVEIGMIHYVDSLSDWETVQKNGILDYARALKASGVIGHIGLSSHNPKVARAAIESGIIEVLMFAINPCYDLQPGNEDLELLWAEKSYEHPLLNMDAEREQLYEACQRRGIGITVMKAFGGGDLLNEKLSPAGAALTLPQCIHYALSRPAVATVLAGAHSTEQLKACVAYEDASDEEKDYASALSAFPRISWKGHCMYCSHCAPCPVGISVADVTKFFNLCRAQGGVIETVREHYAALTHHAGECIGCGACEKRCPFEVEIRKNMQAAAELFGK